MVPGVKVPTAPRSLSLPRPLARPPRPIPLLARPCPHSLGPSLSPTPGRYADVRQYSNDFLDYLKGGGRMKKGRHWSPTLYQAMDTCWLYDPTERATFKTLVTSLGRHHRRLKASGGGGDDDAFTALAAGTGGGAGGSSGQRTSTASDNFGDDYLNVTGLAPDDDADNDYETMLGKGAGLVVSSTSPGMYTNTDGSIIGGTDHSTNSGASNDHEQYGHYDGMLMVPPAAKAAGSSSGGGGGRGEHTDDAARPYNDVPTGGAKTYDATTTPTGQNDPAANQGGDLDVRAPGPLCYPAPYETTDQRHAPGR